MYFKLAWRNLWRNKRRTLITMASVFFAVLLSILMRSGQLGTYDNMIKNIAGFYTGYIQIHQKGYWDEQIIDNSFTVNDSLYQIVKSISAVQNFVPRLESFALASTGQHSKGVLVVGIDPEKEKLVTHIQNKIVEGSYFKHPDEKAVLLAGGLSRQLNIKVGDTLVLLGQGYHGVSAAGKFFVKGTLQFGSPELNSTLVYLPISTAQWMYRAKDLLTSVVLLIDNPSHAQIIANSVSQSLSQEKYEVMSWEEMLPDLVQLIKMDSAGGIITIFILYMVITFGLFGTLLMMTNERRYEFGIMIAIGMKKLKLAIIVVVETLLIAVAGAIAGVWASIPIIAWLYHHPIRFTGEWAEATEQFGMEPIMPFSIDYTIFTSQAIVVFCITLVLASYPFYKILTLKVIESIRY